MGSVAKIRRERIGRLLRMVIWPATHPLSHPLELSIHRLPGEPIPPERAPALSFEPFSVGQAWGGAWSTAWFRAAGTVPDEFAGHRVVARIDLGFHGQPGFGGEALVFSDGRPLQGVNPAHNSVRLTDSAAGGERVDLLVEAAANPVERGAALEWPLLLPDYRGRDLYTLARFDIAAVDTAMMEVLYDWTILTELVDELGLEDRRSAEILQALDQVAREADLADLQNSVVERRESWAELLERPTRAGSHETYAVGHAHIDSAWLWPIRETKRKCARTFSTAVGLMKGDPDFVFVCSQAQQHAWMKEDYPTLFAEMRRFAGEGQLEPVGSMWVEPDTNLPSGESLVRQLVFGKRFFLEHYGLETSDCWLPDAFGYSGNLPQILRSAGVDRFFTQKLSWNEIDAFPHHTFWWEGIDGSRVLAHCPPTDTYNAAMTVSELMEGERHFAQHGVSGRSLYVYGFGDGGGGPTEEMLERARRLADLDPLPRLRLSRAKSFFDDLEKDLALADEREQAAFAGSSRTAHAPGPGRLPVWFGELYLERHRGVQTTQAQSKLGNRRSERLLREAELSVLLFLDQKEAASATRRIEQAWKTVLLHQFHDILPGSGIHWVHQDSRRAYAEVESELTEVIGQALQSLAGRLAERRSGPALLAFNAATAQRSEVVEVDRGSLGWTESEEASLQPIGEGRALVRLGVEGSGWTTVAADGAAAARPAAVDPGGRSIENGLVCLSLDENGNLSSLCDLVLGRELLAEGSTGNLFQLHHDLPNNFDAWDVDQGAFERAYDQLEAESIEVTENGPLRAALRVRRRIGRASRLTQEIRLAAGSKRVDFVTTVDWQESHRMLKVSFPLSVRSPRATFEVQFGHVERPTHANTSWDEARFEVPAQRFAALAEPGFGVGLLNDCKHGYDVRANVLRLSLLRAPGWPDPKADRGRHQFTYALYPYAGEAGFSELLHEAERLNVPIRLVPLPPSTEARGAGSLPASGSALALSGAMLSSLKLADDSSGDRIVRLYEATGARSMARLSGLGRTAVSRVDSLERPGDEIGEVDGELHLELRPFELVTLRLRRPRPTGQAARDPSAPPTGRARPSPGA